MGEATSGDIASLRNTINSLRGEIGQLDRAQAQLHDAVGTVAMTQDLARSELNELRAEFAAYLRRDELARALQLAQTQIIAVRQEVESRYGHFATVRRLATGTLEGMDTGIVTHETLQATSEELMITTPRYWLAPALVALAAWIRDDEALAQRALTEALRRDNDKTSLFFALVLRRQDRNAATARWLRQFIARQDPAALSHEFTVVLDAAATGALGPDARPYVMHNLGEWYDRLCADPAVVAAQVGRWRQLVDGMRTPIDRRFTVLPAISPTWPTLKSVYEGATVHGRALGHFRGIFDRPLRPDPQLQQRVDEILATLVTSFDTEEAPHRAKEAQLQAIIDHEGDKAAATAVVAAEASLHEETVDYLTLLTNAGFFPEKVGASDGTQRMAIALARDWVVAAAGQLEVRNVAGLPTAVTLETEGWSGVIDDRASEGDLVASLRQHIDAETEAQVASIRLGGGAVAAVVLAGFAVVIALICAFSGSPGGAVFFLIVAVGFGIWVGHQYMDLQPRRDHARRLGEQRLATATAQVQGAIAETLDWRRDWEREISAGAALRSYLNGLNRDAFVTSTAGASREVIA